MNPIPWEMFVPVFLAVLPLTILVGWNLIELKSFKAEVHQDLNDIRKELASIRERLATLEERDRVKLVH